MIIEDRKSVPTFMIMLACIIALYGNTVISNQIPLASALLHEQSGHEDFGLTLSGLIEDGSPYLGSESAPIVIVEFSDFQCHMCKRHVDSTEPEIKEHLIDTGKAAYVFKYLPNRGFDSMTAAIAAQCSNEQGKFWEYSGILFRNQGNIDSGWITSENLKNFALEVQGLDTDRFNSCLDNSDYESHINNDLALANTLGITGTPSFMIMKNDGSNSVMIEGAKPFPIFQAVISDIG